MLLAVDIGNTNISLGIFKNDSLVKKLDIPTKSYSRTKLKKALAKAKFESAIICSVVPKVSKVVEKDLVLFLKRQPLILGKDITVPIRNCYRKPSQVGQDRLVNAYAAGVFYGAPLVVVDFGTAITFDVVSSKNEYLGGMIIPGLRISLEALYERTALLPKVKLEKPRDFIGRDTKNSMLCGIVFGFAALSDELIRKIRLTLGKGSKTIGTGGNISFIKRYCTQFDVVDTDLTLKGLLMIYKNQNKLKRFKPKLID